MVTGAIKNKVDKIWTDIWAGGITNPLTVIEQLTYLMFIRSLDEKELATEDFENMAGEKMEHIFPASAAGQSMRWSRFKDKDSREIFLTMQQRVFPAIKKMKYGRLPDFDANGELVEIADDPTRPDEGNTAFARYIHSNRMKTKKCPLTVEIRLHRWAGISNKTPGYYYAFRTSAGILFWLRYPTGRAQRWKLRRHLRAWRP